MNKIQLLHELLGRLEVCTDPDCLVCERIKSDIEALGKELELTEAQLDEIMPWALKRRNAL
jgi:hypothetical protein